ncbi:succinate dehydrogenase cytochrome b556 subunit [Psychrobium sp. 1_MG-2023]|uniref:succinate dehydrogenase cytochrome b556 subunit n=1 Tax=Psychrobium sp. 1_MG-2023 TaxID=3062624 RepID=UPI000C33F41B|nr:succinate dehydrogenase cytochrome b556 subunit [Psychrobium sp. 1_MG-2023]MDP2559932.1 succinate dehydrogenase cytochrome b556 subunit [Psychrobium sp. 1_MG-2023]PKF56399.1 succinate dehydrogenase cytochrome b556 large subunit [Alteromonadales bacterium alter-6D02]
MSTIVKKQRPVNLDLQTVSFPLTAIASILHRISGVIMFVATGILMWFLAESLSGPVGFANVQELMGSFLAKFIFWGILTALAYHLVVGVRHIVMDMGYGEELDQATASAKFTMIASGVLSFLAGVWVW